MKCYSIDKIKENKNGIEIEVQVNSVKKFLEFKNKLKKFTIWKLCLSDYSGNAVFFCDEKLDIGRNENFHASDIRLTFHRGKKKFILRKILSKSRGIKREYIFPNYKLNISILEHKLV